MVNAALAIQTNTEVILKNEARYLSEILPDQCFIST